MYVGQATNIVAQELYHICMIFREGKERNTHTNRVRQCIYFVVNL